MSFLRRIVVIVALACIMVGSCSVGLARSVYDWHVPQPMTSTDAAIAAIKELRGALSLDASYSIRDLAVDQLGLQITAAKGNKEKRFGLTFSQLTSFDQMNDEEGKFYSFLTFTAGPSIQVIQAASPAHGRKLIDAVVTLALAQNAPLVPYRNFNTISGSSGYIETVLKKAQVTAGAVVDTGAPDSPLMSDDVIIQATYAGKVFPITGKDTWDAVCREAAAGKAEETIVAKIIRSGMAMEKEVKLINYRFGAKTGQGGPGQQAPQSKGFGIQVRMLEPAELKPLGLERSVAFLVLSVAQDSVAEMLQLKANDVLLAINGVEIGSPTQLIELIAKGPVMMVKILREGQVMTLQSALTI